MTNLLDELFESSGNNLRAHGSRCRGSRITRASVGAKKVSPYFSFTNSKTKIAHTPTVTGNSTSWASRNAPPRGSAYVSPNIAAAVSMPSINFAFELMGSLLGLPISLRSIAKTSPAGAANLGFVARSGLRQNLRGTPLSTSRVGSDYGPRLHYRP